MGCMENEIIRVRVAPSPTGKFHFGSARVALFNYLFAKKFSGKFLLRIEDTDKVRSTPESEIDIIECMSWLGLNWDEGPVVGGAFGPYKQSERTAIYQEYINLLLESGAAYYCFCTPEELAKEREGQEKRHEMPRYSGKCRDLSKKKVEEYLKAGKKATIRFRVGNEKITFTDLIKGPMEFDMSLFGDFVIAGSDGNPLFLLTNSIDDVFMKVTHVLRGEDHLSNTPKQIMLLQAMNMLPPEYGHFPMILNTDKSKMSKRKNPVSISEDYRDKGYLPEAMINFMALLGWHPSEDREIFTLDELETEFSLDRVSKSPAIYDIKKLDYLNGYYIRKKLVGELASLCLPFLEKSDAHAIVEAQKNPDYYLSTISLVQQRMRRLDEVHELTHYFFEDELQYDMELLIPKNSDRAATKRNLQAGLAAITRAKSFGREDLEVALLKVVNELNISVGELLWPIRAAVTGEKASPNVFELIEVLGKERSVKRISAAIAKLEG